MKAPRIVIAGERSGVGKSTITIGILSALRARGLRVQAFKAGPDFLDPMHHSIVLDRPSRNLDTWMFGPAVPELFIRSAEDADISVIEGVMGLYDGVNGRDDKGSTAHLSKLLHAPVVLVVDAKGSARSAGAVALGFKEYDPEVDIAGVIFNNVGSEKHLSMLRDSLRGLDCLGGLPRIRAGELRERHLGLVPAEEQFNEDGYGAIREMVERHLDIDGLIELAHGAKELELKWGSSVFGAGGKAARIGVARDAAFNFYYQDNLDILRSFGAELVPFSPMDDALPDVDGLYFGGGYPELFASELTSNVGLRDQVREASSKGMPIYAECGGLMYMCREVVDLEGAIHDMAGIFDVRVEMTERLQALAYVDVQVIAGNVLAMEGECSRGHVFHYSRLTDPPGSGYSYLLNREKGARGELDGLVVGNTLASYTHLHFASCPRWAERFVERCREHARSRQPVRPCTF
jgi:cobyrinic acid a,c-diamide synthase